MLIFEEEEPFAYGVYHSVRFSWEYSSHNRGEAPDTEGIINDILKEIDAEEYLRAEAELE